MITGMKITSVGMPTEILSGRGLAAPIRLALTEAIEVWHGKMLPRHFRGGAAERYGYRPRKAATVKRKYRFAAATGNYEARLPLVWTGRLRRMVTSAVCVTTSRAKGRGHLRAPGYAHMYSRGGNRPYLAGEVLTVIDDEAEALGRVVEWTLTALLNGNRRRRVLRV